MPATSVIALFDSFANARAAEKALIEAGIAPASMGLLANNTAPGHPRPFTNPAHAAPDAESLSLATAEVGAGTAAGFGIGGMIGGAMELCAFMLPGIGPVVATGLWTGILAGLGGIFGGAVAALSDEEIPPNDAELYAEGLRRGATLLVVRCDARDVAAVRGTTRAHGACDIEERGRAWRAEGWVGLDGAPSSDAENPGTTI